MVNDSNDRLSTAHLFHKISRNQGTLKIAKECSRGYGKELRKWCHVKFEYGGRCKATEGIVLSRS